MERCLLSSLKWELLGVMSMRKEPSKPCSDRSGFVLGDVAVPKGAAGSQVLVLESKAKDAAYPWE